MPEFRRPWRERLAVHYHRHLPSPRSKSPNNSILGHYFGNLGGTCPPVSTFLASNFGNRRSICQCQSVPAGLVAIGLQIANPTPSRPPRLSLACTGSTLP